MTDSLYANDKIEGKTIAKMVRRASHIALAFTDGTHVTLEAEPVSIDEATVEFTETMDYDLFALGLISKEELARREQAERDKLTNRRRAEFERMKKEFEP